MQRVKREKVAALKDIEKVEAKAKEEGLKEVTSQPLNRVDCN